MLSMPLKYHTSILEIGSVLASGSENMHESTVSAMTLPLLRFVVVAAVLAFPGLPALNANGDAATDSWKAQRTGVPVCEHF